jgi:hypothetical protein
MSLEGKIQIQADLVPTNDNPRMSVTDNKYVKGAPQVFHDIDELIAFHPNRMKAGMPATILNYPSAGSISDYRLSVDPSTILDSSKNTIVTGDNFHQFWELQSVTETSRTRVYQYSADGPGGGAPVFPYTEDEEDNWVNTFDASRSHRWMRFRDDDEDENEDGIFDNWTLPIPINNAYTSGDYIENRFKRQAVSSTVHVVFGTLVSDKYYMVEGGSVQIDGDLTLNDIGSYSDVATQANLTSGRRFKFASANTYTFLSSATVTETVPPPPRTVSGLPNNEPVGWSDTIPVGSAQLWQITAQKSVYGQLKSEWLIRKIPESPNYVRYSNKPTPHPDTIAGVNTSANTGSSEDLALIAAEWVSTYDDHDFIATREDDPGADLYTPWLVEKINEESGEYTDRVFKLFDLNLDADSVDLSPPTLRDPTTEGWSDTPLPETATQINYISEARKFFNGELKTTWSPPVPYTGKDTFSDVIQSDLGDNFKYTVDDTVSPEEITLKALLYKGVSELWQDEAVTITYVWKKVFNDGLVGDESPTSSDTDDFYTLPENGTIGDADYFREFQRVVIKPEAVTGLAVFRCTQTITMGDGDDLVFEDEFTVLDVTDGKDAKVIGVLADNDRIIWDTIELVFSPVNVLLRVYTANIPSPTYYWYRWDGAAWETLANGIDGYTITGNICQIACADLFSSDSTAQEQLYAVSTHATNPESADFETTFSDYITVAKLSSAGTGEAGENAVVGVLSNEAHTVVLDSSTGSPQAGEITASGRAITTLTVYDGLTQLIYNTDYTIALADDNADITFDKVANGSDVDIYVDTWGAGERSVVCTITITYGSIIFTKKFSLSSTQDAPGAVILDIDSDKGFTFTPADKTNKTLTAKLYDTALSGDQQISLPDAAYTFRWNIAGVWTSLTTDNTQTVTRSNILVTGNVTVECYLDAVLFRSRTISVADVNDGQAYRAWTSNATKPSSSQDLGAQDPTNGGIWPVTVSGVVWRLPSDSHWDSNTPTYAQDAEVDTGVYTWGKVYQLKGEKGDQGGAGNFFFPMYIASITSPAYGAGGNTSSLAQMQSAGWSAKPPSVGRIWKTQRPWVGQGVTFDGSGNPSTSPVSGTSWDAVLPITATDGINGDNGDNGNDGWSPIPALVAGTVAGTKVIEIVDWTGGEGTKPDVGYIGSSGITSVLADAVTVTGEPIELRYSSGVIQWKYTSEGSGLWRNLLAVKNENQYNVPHSVGGSNQTISGSAVTLVTAALGSASYQRKVILTAHISVRSDSSDLDDVVVAVFQDLGGITVYQYPETRYRPMSHVHFQTIHIHGWAMVPASSAANFRLQFYNAVGGGAIYKSDVCCNLTIIPLQ